MGAMQSFVNALTLAGSNMLQMGGSGITLDQNGEPIIVEIEPQDLTLHEGTQTELRGYFTVLLPDGITLEDFSTANGWEEVDEIDGRQRIKISINSLVQGEEFSFRIHVTWWYILSQIWIYPAILISLIVWRVRARRAKKKRKREKEQRKNEVVIGKGGLNDSDFAALSAGHDPTIPGGAGFDLYDDDLWDHP